MRRILIWTDTEITGLADEGLSRILTEVDEEGFVTRELGFDIEGNLVHRYPGKPTRAEYGLFDLAKIDARDRTEASPEEFDRLFDEEFWAENDPYSDRFATRVPWWGCLGIALLLGCGVFLLLR
jgi:hypothetical protein